MMRGGVLLGAWIAFVIVAYILALIFIVPPTDEARLAVSALFLCCGIQITSVGIIAWVRR